MKVTRGGLVITEVTWKEKGDQDALLRRVMALLLSPPNMINLQSAITVESAESLVLPVISMFS